MNFFAARFNVTAVCVAILIFATPLTGQEQAATPTDHLATHDSKLEDLSPAVRQLAERLDAKLPEGSEARAMFEAILEGSRLGPEDGWFSLAPAKTRYDWQAVQQLFDADHDGRVTAEEYPAPQKDFACLDRDGDGALAESDLKWPEHALAWSPGATFFYSLDRDGNGKVTDKECAAWCTRLNQEADGFLTLDDLRAAFPAPDETLERKTPEHPTQETLLIAFDRQELGSFESGPDLNEAAPDFTLKTIDGTETVSLSNRIGKKPVVLVFGNFTCGPFRTQAGNLERLYRQYGERANFLMIYVREAHPTGGWFMNGNERLDIRIDQPKDLDERAKVAARCQVHLGMEMPFYVDTIDDEVGLAYSGMPSRLYVIDAEGRIAFKSGRGPFGFKPRELEQALVLLLTTQQQQVEAAPAGRKPE